MTKNQGLDSSQTHNSYIFVVWACVPIYFPVPILDLSFTRAVNKHHVLAVADLRAERRKRPTKLGSLSAPSTNVNLPVIQALPASEQRNGRLPWLVTLCRNESLETFPALYSQGLIHSLLSQLHIALSCQKTEKQIRSCPIVLRSPSHYLGMRFFTIRQRAQFVNYSCQLYDIIALLWC